jgi:Sec7-like guanine-nucleotide exchange factor
MGFASRYKSCNESCTLSVDGVYMLSFNIIMLLTNTHNIGVRTKMTFVEFIMSLEGTTAECAVDLGNENLLQHQH